MQRFEPPARVECGTRIPAAEYLRVSHQDQTNGLKAQAQRIRAYAEHHGFRIVKTYVDHGRSGLVVQRRKGLRDLLNDVVARCTNYKVILVDDVSRWGRFQDSDEAAHYEFLCKQSGVPIHYCSEAFTNLRGMGEAILKNLGRTMAGEYSRELSDKCFHAQKHLAELGYRVGGKAGYGFRREAICSNGSRRALEAGEYKSLITDRVILTLGPAKEVDCIKRMFELVLKNRSRPAEIARDLNDEGRTYKDNRAWNADAVRNILRNPKYAGKHVWNRNSRRLHGPTIHVPRAEWVVRDDVIPAIIDKRSFERAQRILRRHNKRWSDAELLESLRMLRIRTGHISQKLIAHTAGMASVGTYHRRLGSLRQLHLLIGFRGRVDLFDKGDQGQRTQALRDRVVEEIVALFPTRVSIVHLPHRRRPVLRFSNGYLLSVLMCVPGKYSSNGRSGWVANTVPSERHLITLLCFSNKSRTKCLRYYLLPRTQHARIRTTYAGRLLKTGVRLSSLSHLYQNVRIFDPFRLE
jgi:DNA invertase Pin-like site-specific DNA recombinase